MTGKLDELNSMLMKVENDLLKRGVDRRDAEIENAYEFINELADDGTINIDCHSCDDSYEEDVQSE